MIDVEYDDYDVSRYPNPNRPAKPLIIQSIFGDEEILNFLIDDFDKTMQAFRDLGNRNCDKIWAYQKIVYSDLIEVIELSNAVNKESLREKLKKHFEDTREKRETKGYLKGQFRGEY